MKVFSAKQTLISQVFFPLIATILILISFIPGINRSFMIPVAIFIGVVGYFYLKCKLEISESLIKYSAIGISYEIDPKEIQEVYFNRITPLKQVLILKSLHINYVIDTFNFSNRKRVETEMIRAIKQKNPSVVISDKIKLLAD